LLVAAILIGLGNFLVVLDTTIANVSVPTIAGNLGVSSSQGTWVITSYAVAEAITVPLTGWLAGKFGAKRVFLTCFLSFAALSLLVNGAVLAMLNGYRTSTEPHLRAAWVDTRADVLVNAGVLLSGVLVALLGYPLIDLAVGAVVALFVIHEGWELWEAGGDDAG